jgi:signal transduction histidine kinase
MAMKSIDEETNSFLVHTNVNSPYFDLQMYIFGLAMIELFIVSIVTELLQLDSQMDSQVQLRTKDLLHANQLLIKSKSDAENAAKEAKNAQLIAETATQVKSEFLSTMSHEIRTPMVKNN